MGAKDTVIYDCWAFLDAYTLLLHVKCQQVQCRMCLSNCLPAYTYYCIDSMAWQFITAAYPHAAHYCLLCCRVLVSVSLQKYRDARVSGPLKQIKHSGCLLVIDYSVLLHQHMGPVYMLRPPDARCRQWLVQSPCKDLFLHPQPLTGLWMLVKILQGVEKHCLL